MILKMKSILIFLLILNFNSNAQEVLDYFDSVHNQRTWDINTCLKDSTPVFKDSIILLKKNCFCKQGCKPTGDWFFVSELVFHQDNSFDYNFHFHIVILHGDTIAAVNNMKGIWTIDPEFKHIYLKINQEKIDNWFSIID